MLKENQDAYGQEIFAFFQGEEVLEIVERDDGFIDAFPGPEHYFRPFTDWPARQQQAMKFVRGRVLDIGCGAGRVSLHLQEMGLDVLGIDNSPLALEVCSHRGVKQTSPTPITRVSKKLGTFDSIVMLGNNFGLFGSPKLARWLLRRWKGMTSINARIIAESNNIYQTEAPYHMAYHQFNRERNRLAGQLRIRVRFRNYSSPWFEYMMVSPHEMGEILDGTGWAIDRIIQQPDESQYVAIIEKTNAA